jgi:hypothetical protein
VASVRRKSCGACHLARLVKPARPIASITKRDAIVLLDDRVDAGHGVTANRTLTNLKTFFGWCVKRDMLTASPVAVLDAPAEEKSRERVLNHKSGTLRGVAGIYTDWPAARVGPVRSGESCRSSRPEGLYEEIEHLSK